MKAGDLIEMPQGRGLALVISVSEYTLRDGTVARSVVCLASYGEDYWDANACKVISESR